jgi:hypothetical protein
MDEPPDEDARQAREDDAYHRLAEWAPVYERALLLLVGVTHREAPHLLDLFLDRWDAETRDLRRARGPADRVLAAEALAEDLRSVLASLRSTGDS